MDAGRIRDGETSSMECLGIQGIAWTACMTCRAMEVPMYDLETIRRMSSAEARASRKRHDVPYIPPVSGMETMKIPNLGDRCPKGWKRVNIIESGLPFHGVYAGDNRDHGAYFVDSTGLGSPGEAAITVSEFLAQVDTSGKYGYAVVEAGQFQVKIGVFALI